MSDPVRDDVRNQVQGDTRGGERQGLRGAVRGAAGRLRVSSSRSAAAAGRAVQARLQHRQEDRLQNPPRHRLREDSLRGLCPGQLRVGGGRGPVPQQDPGRDRGLAGGGVRPPAAEDVQAGLQTGAEADSQGDLQGYTPGSLLHHPSKPEKSFHPTPDKMVFQP